MSVPVRSATELAAEVPEVAKALEMTDLLRRGGTGWLMFWKTMPDIFDAALVALADEAAKFKRAHEVAAKFANQNIERAVNAEARVAELETAHSKAMEALAADVHPYSGPAIRDWEQEHTAALAELRSRAEQKADPDYSPAYQDEYQRLWHEAVAEREAAERERDRMRAALEGLANVAEQYMDTERGDLDGWIDRARAVLAGLSQPGNTQP